MKVGILTGGGDCPGLNPAIRGVGLSRATSSASSASGIMEGWRGLVKGIYEPLGLKDVEEIHYQGGTILGSSRTNPFKKPGRFGDSVLEEHQERGLRCDHRVRRRGHAWGGREALQPATA